MHISLYHQANDMGGNDGQRVMLADLCVAPGWLLIIALLIGLYVIFVFRLLGRQNTTPSIPNPPALETANQEVSWTSFSAIRFG